MTLRTRLIVTSLAVAVPLAGALIVIDDRLRGQDQDERLASFATTELQTGLLDRCRAADGIRGLRGGRRGGPPPISDGAEGGRRPPPPPQGGEGRPYDVLTYSATFEPAGVSLPPFDDDLRTALATADRAIGPFRTAEGRGRQLAMWVDRADATHCAIALFRMPPRRGELRDRLTAIALILVSVLGAAWIAAIPVLSRLRRLSAAMHRAAATQDATPVPVEGRDEVADVAAVFNQTSAEIAAHVRELAAREDALRQFVANTAHDVGLPLTVLQGHLAKLDRGGNDGGASAAASTHVRAAINEVHYLGSLIRNLNAATRLDAHAVPLALQPVDLSALVERVVARSRMVAQSSGVELNHAVPEAPLTVPAEPTLVEQTLGNLVDNAIRHNRAGGHVAVVLEAHDRGFEITVTDDGPGVPEADLTRLTERWFRSDDARTRRPDGQGLGLAIAAESMKRLGWVLTFERPGEGGLRAAIRART